MWIHLSCEEKSAAGEGEEDDDDGEEEQGDQVAGRQVVVRVRERSQRKERM